MRIPDYIGKKRLEKGLSIEQLSEAVGLDVWDLELHEDELDGLTLLQLGKLCGALDIKPVDILTASIADREDLSLSDLIRERRTERGYSVEELADLIGYDRAVIEALENGGDLDCVCVDALKEIAVRVDIPITLLFEKL